MSCASGGGDGHSVPARPARVRPRFFPGVPSAAGDLASEGRVLIEPETGDNSEQQFAASLDTPSHVSRPRFVPGSPGNGLQPSSRKNEDSAPAATDATRDEGAAGCDSERSSGEEVRKEAADSRFAAEGPRPDEQDAAFLPELRSETVVEAAGPGVSEGDVGAAEDAGEAGPQWRQEVAARLHNYHSRRTRKPPRYPSLALKFDPPVYASPPTSNAEPARAMSAPAPSRSEAATAAAAVAEEVEEARAVAADANNVIEFPRPLVPPPPRPDELAEPILDMPRILDAPEAVPKQVPLGGIILQPEETVGASELELPLQVAPLGRRLTAAALDAALVGAATLMFALIADKIAVLLPSARVLLGLGVALPAILWAVFQYVFLVYTGSTPGMRLTGLRLSDFDGSAPDRVTRRWRALAMALSAVSLGLGFLWCLLDEDTLCWHDRITRTYLDAGSSPAAETRHGAFFPQRVFAALRRAEAFLQRREQEISQQPPAPPRS